MVPTVGAVVLDSYGWGSAPSGRGLIGAELGVVEGITPC